VKGYQHDKNNVKKGSVGWGLALRHRRGAHGWSQQLAKYIGGAVPWLGVIKTRATVRQVPEFGCWLCGKVMQWCM
jgi:hypothetical protein